MLAPLAGPSSDSLSPAYNTLGQPYPAQLQLSPNGSSAYSSSSQHSGKSADELDGQPAENGSEASEAAFQTTFYDPFRIKHRRRTTPQQLKILEGHFVVNAKPDVTMRKALAEQLSMSPREVQVWFQNRRAKTKKLREKAEKEGEDPDAAVAAASAAITGRQPPALTLPPQIAPFAGSSNDSQSLRRGSSPAILTHAGGQYLDHNDDPAPQYAPQHQQFSQQHQQYYNLPQQQPQQQQYRQPQYISAQQQPAVLNGAYTDSPSHSPENSFIQQPAYLDPSFDQHTQVDASGRRFSLPAHTMNGQPANGYSQFEQHPQHHQTAIYHPQPLPAANNLAAVHSTEDLVALSSTTTSPNFASFSNDNLREPGDFSPSSSADELSSGAIDPSYAAYNQPQQVYPVAGYSFGSGVPVQVPSEPMTPIFLPQQVGQDVQLSPDGFDHTRRLSCPPEFNAAFNGLGLASPQQPSSIWQPQMQQPSSGYLPPQLPNGAPLDLATHPALLQKRHSVANGHLPGTGLGGTYNAQTGQFIPASSANQASYGIPSNVQQQQQQQQQPQQQMPYQPGSFLQANLPAGINASLATRRGSTSSLLGTIAEQPGPGQVSTRLGYGVTAEGYALEGGSPEHGPYANLERRGSLAGPAANSAAVARKARSQQSLRSSPYAQETTRRSPPSALGHDRAGSSNGLEYGQGAY